MQRIFITAILLSISLSGTSLAQTANKYTTNEIDVDSDLDSDSDSKQKSISCENQPYLALLHEVGIEVFYNIISLSTKENMLKIAKDDKYAQVVCEGVSSTNFRLENGGMFDNLQKVLNPVTDYVLTTPNLKNLSNVPDDRVKEFCKNPRKAKILSLPNTPECKMAAQGMLATGLGSPELGVAADQEKVNEIREQIRKKVEEGSPISIGVTELAIAAVSVAAAFATGYQIWDDMREDANDLRTDVNRINELDNQIKESNDRIDEIDNDLRIIKEIRAKDEDGIMGFGEGVEVVSKVSKKTADKTLKSGGDSYDDFKETAVRDQNNEIQNKRALEQERDGLKTKNDCDPAKEGCGISCVEDGCMERAVATVFGPAQQAIAMCIKQKNTFTPRGRHQKIHPSIMDEQTPNCEIQYVDDPCLSISPDGCGEDVQESLMKQRKRELATKTVNSLHCRADDLACNETVTAVHQIAYGQKPTGFIHDMLCGNTVFVQPSLPSNAKSDSIWPRFGEQRNDCRKFMGIERCGSERICHNEAKKRVLASQTIDLDFIQRLAISTFLVDYPKCQKFEKNITNYWRLYSSHLWDARQIEQAMADGTVKIEDFGGLTKKLPTVLDTITIDKKFVFDPTSRNNSLGDKFDSPQEPALGSDKYYKKHFCNTTD